MQKRMKIGTGLSVVLLIFLGACMNADEDSASRRLLDDINSIDSYLASKNITAVRDINGVRMVISKLGKGYPARIFSQTSSHSVNVTYAGRLFPDGAQFDAGTINGPLLDYIDGWKIAFTSLPEGSSARIYVPSGYGYGPGGSGSIPGNAILEFDVTFNRINRSTAELQQLAADTVAIRDYLQQKGITAQKDSTGYSYVITEEGNGAIPQLYNSLEFNITYKLLTADTQAVVSFDSAPGGQTLNRAVDQVDALKSGLTKLRVGSKATFYVPSTLGFGAPGMQPIPGNANLIIDISLTRIVE